MFRQARSKSRRFLTMALGATLVSAAVVGCERDDMRNQARVEPYERSDFFADEMSVRPQVAGTVARGQLRDGSLLYTGNGADGQVSDQFPFAITMDHLQRGRQRYDIYCLPCHGALGDGQGMIVQRGFTPPPSFHQERLRNAPAGHFFQVMTNGWGAMYDYSDRINVEDRWNIAAYVKALQLSQSAAIGQLPEEDRQALAKALEAAERDKTAPTTAPAAAEGAH